MADLAFQPVSMDDAQAQAAAFQGAPPPPPPPPGPIPGVPPQFANLTAPVPMPTDNGPLPAFFSPSGGAPLNPNPPPPSPLGPEYQPGAPPPGTAPGSVPPVAPGAPPRSGGGGAGGRQAKPDALETDLVKAGQKAVAGAEQVQQAKAEGQDALARATEDLAVQQRSDAQELADKQAQNRQLQAQLDQQDAANLQKARDYTIPDFWKGAEGAKVGSVISIAAGAIASGVLGGPNGALNIINKYTDDYAYKQKQKIDNLYKYAEQTGRLNDRTRLRYAQELLDLKDQHTAIQASILTRLKAVEAKNQGAVDTASTQGITAGLERQIVEDRQKSRDARMHLNLIASGQAETARHNRAMEGIAQENADTKKAGGAGPGNEALAVRDPATGEVRAYAHSKQEAAKLGPQLNAGNLYIESLQALKKNIASGYIVNPYSDAGKERMQFFNDAVAKGRSARGLGVSNANLALEHGAFGGPGVGTNVKLITPQVIDNMIKDARDKQEGIYRGLTPAQGQQAPAAGGQPAQTPPKQYPIGARSTSGGKPIVMTANGWQFAS